MPKSLRWPALAVLAFLAVAVPGAAACAIDGVPSIYANGHLATRNLVVPKKASFLSWSPFIFRQPFARGTTIHLREDNAKISSALGAARLRERWQWAFGDNSTIVAKGGTAVGHRYTRAGQYRIVISTYDPASRQWFPFDSSEVTIRS